MLTANTLASTCFSALSFSLTSGGGEINVIGRPAQQHRRLQCELSYLEVYGTNNHHRALFVHDKESSSSSLGPHSMQQSKGSFLPCVAHTCCWMDQCAHTDCSHSHHPSFFHACYQLLSSVERTSIARREQGTSQSLHGRKNQRLKTLLSWSEGSKEPSS